MFFFFFWFVGGEEFFFQAVNVMLQLVEHNYQFLAGGRIS